MFFPFLLSLSFVFLSQNRKKNLKNCNISNFKYERNNHVFKNGELVLTYRGLYIGESGFGFALFKVDFSVEMMALDRVFVQVGLIFCDFSVNF